MQMILHEQNLVEAVQARDDARASYELYRSNVAVVRQEIRVLASASQEAVAISRSVLHRVQSS